MELVTLGSHDHTTLDSSTHTTITPAHATLNFNEAHHACEIYDVPSTCKHDSTDGGGPW